MAIDAYQLCAEVVAGRWVWMMERMEASRVGPGLEAERRAVRICKATSSAVGALGGGGG